MRNTDNWKGYYDAIEDRPSKALVRAIQNYCKEKDYALDIAAGNLRDTKYLLEEGFNVVAIDPSPVSIKLAGDLKNEDLTMFPDLVGAYEFPKNHFSVVNAQGILFHLPEPRFSFVINKISQTLKKGGVLCADFIGEKDTWNYPGTSKTIVTPEKLKEVFADFEIVFLRESEQDETEEFAKKKGASKPKHWHHINIIAIKN